MKFVNVLSFSFLVFLFIASCDTNEPPVQSTLVLKLEDVSCTEAWLQLTSANIQLPNNISVLINGSVKKTLTLNSKDSLIYIDSLFPNQTYKLLATMQQSSNASNELSITTLDTTSHNFTWQTFEFGQHSSSILYDVAIIDENNIWAVGEIYMNDSLGTPDPIAYNAINWNGTEWKPKKINVLFRGNVITPPLESVFALSDTDIWFVGSLPIHGNGTTWIMYDLRTTVDPNISLSRGWGNSSTEMYFVGRAGNIAQYKNGNWTKIESGTSQDLQDIWGVENEDGNFIKFIAADNQILMLDADNKIASVNVAQNMILLSIWGKTPNLLYTAGNGAILYKNYGWESLNNSNVNHMYRVRGQEYNDVFGISSPGNIINHFNGSSWLTYNEHYMQGILVSIATKNKIVVTVGLSGSKAIIIKGERN